MQEYLNLSLRTKVLAYALELEKGVSEILYSCFSLEKGGNFRAFGNKSSNISFQNKIDILRDIGILNITSEDDSYTPLESIMQFRNKFLHIHDCNSFMDAYNFIGDGFKMKRYLPKDTPNKNVVIDEQLLSDTFDKVYANCETIIRDKIDTIQANEERRTRRMQTLVMALRTYIRYNEKLNEDFTNRIKEITEWNDSVRDNLTTHIAAEFTTNEAFIQMIYGDLSDDTVIERFFDLINNPKYKQLTDL